MSGKLSIRHLFKNREIIFNHRLEKALKSSDPFVALYDLFQDTLRLTRSQDQFIPGKALGILERGYRHALENNDSRNAYLFLYRILNFSTQYDKYTDLIDYSIAQDNRELTISLIDELETQYRRNIIDAKILKKLTSVLLSHVNTGAFYIKYSLPLIKNCHTKKEYISILEKTAKTRFEQKQYDDAKEFYLEILKNRVRTKELFEALAHIYIKENQLAYAARYFEEAMKLNTDNRDLLLYFGSYYYQKGDYNSAKSVFLLYDALHPEYMKGKDILAEIFLNEKNYDDALFYIQQLSDYYIQNNEIQKAYSIYKRLISSCRENIEIRSAYINFLESVGDYKAIKEQNLIVGTIYFAKDDLDRAFDHFVLLQDLANAQGDFFYQQKILGYIYQIQLRNKDYRNAIITLHSLINVCKEINDIRLLEKFKLELIKLEAKDRTFEKTAKSEAVRPYVQSSSGVISDLRNLANSVMEIKNSDREAIKAGETFGIRNATSQQQKNIQKAIDLRRTGKHNEAKKLLISIVKVNKDIPLAYPHLFHIFLRENDILACQKVVSTALRISHLTLFEKSMFLLFFGYTFLRTEDYEKALKYYKLAYNMNNNLDIMEKLDYIYRKNEEKKIEIRLNKILDPLMK